ncbi:hypothetical protein N0V85_004391 [Neurospora sp. IMI 360204]|nr:hypothetical protein N0V85_004391 [Neurospora sp. IMI 360204]
MLVTRVLGTLGALALTQLVSAAERPLYPRTNATEVSSPAPVESLAPEESVTAYTDKGFCEEHRHDCRKCVEPIVTTTTVYTPKPASTVTVTCTESLLYEVTGYPETAKLYLLYHRTASLLGLPWILATTFIANLDCSTRQRLRQRRQSSTLES